jgi:hypothetical protein
MVASSWALILGAAGTPPSLPVKVARLGEPPSWRPSAPQLATFPARQPSIAARPETHLGHKETRPAVRPLHLPRALRSRVTECEHDVQPNPHANSLPEPKTPRLSPKTHRPNVTRTSLLAPVLASIGTVGDAYDNASAESFVDSFKTELIRDRVWRTRTQLELAVVEYVAWFNTERLHTSLGGVPPAEFEQQHARR